MGATPPCRTRVVVTGLVAAALLAACATPPADPAPRAEADASPGEEQRARSVRTVNAFYRSLQDRDIDHLSTLWTTDATYRMPTSLEGPPGELVGREEIVSALDDFITRFGETHFTWQVEPMLDPGQVMAVWSCDIDLLRGGSYRNEGVAIFEMSGDRIAVFREYYDTAAFHDAF
ncbi:nuclear transport factor 2 family protein [Allonocardiopsis opalescens]|uniref:Ketosteroid isomerase-like protein n=1 Tax=Allonocardiopsis opalescens TaxID=1144618 RepID=A0A2T0PZX6_9ACTN|nr:nuclear transport factor 2 family protein [Allonocardiopsis opalescens]PRX97005.1 ketosteroid isomerase-like protein [Allonocardiopsis opalescens]